MSESKLVVGKKEPAFTLPDQDGNKVSLTDLAGKWVVLYFYPKDDTPGCTTEACEFTSGIKAFEKLDAVVYGCSPDSPTTHQKFIRKHKLAIGLLSDEDKSVLIKYGAYGQKLMYGKPVTGVIRSTVIIDPAGKVAHHWAKVKAAGHADAVKQTLKELHAG